MDLHESLLAVAAVLAAASASSFPGISLWLFWGHGGWRSPEAYSKIACNIIVPLQYATKNERKHSQRYPHTKSDGLGFAIPDKA